MIARTLELLEHRGISRCLKTGVSGPEMSGPIFRRRGTTGIQISP